MCRSATDNDIHSSPGICAQSHDHQLKYIRCVHIECPSSLSFKNRNYTDRAGMAQQRVRSITRDHTPQFGFSSIKIYPDECLGTGAYGAVCKAMCDELPCAAKLLHSVLFQFNDPGMPAMMRRFQQECELMGRIRHPCIVQYLGTAQDPESYRPILLMELMDESLTKFLERSIAPLAYHIQVNLSYDVALALAYLHSNGVIHRDLSSNNVLIIAGSRAKVTDFGMLKLLEQNMRMTPLTKCPGTVAYMPPEALSDEPEYTDKLDCFSLGVLMIQIITCNFPEPTKATVTVHDPKYPTGRILVPVPEVERRKKDVDLVDDSHPIKSISLSCLKDVERERPSAQELCHGLVELKQEEHYSKSLQQALHGEVEHQRVKEEKQKLEKEHHTLTEIYEQLKEEHQTALSDKAVLETKQFELETLRRTVSIKDREIEELRQHLRDKVRIRIIAYTTQTMYTLLFQFLIADIYIEFKAPMD